MKLKQHGYAKDGPGEPGLCVDKECFETFHIKFDFSN